MRGNRGPSRCHGAAPRRSRPHTALAAVRSVKSSLIAALDQWQSRARLERGTPWPFRNDNNRAFPALVRADLGSCSYLEHDRRQRQRQVAIVCYEYRSTDEPTSEQRLAAPSGRHAPELPPPAGRAPSLRSCAVECEHNDSQDSSLVQTQGHPSSDGRYPAAAPH